MARRSYNKLVRDKVPTAIVQGGDEAITSVLEDKEEIVDLIKQIIQTEDVVLFKASNGMRFFDIVEKLK